MAEARRQSPRWQQEARGRSSELGLLSCRKQTQGTCKAPPSTAFTDLKGIRQTLGEVGFVPASVLFLYTFGDFGEQRPGLGRVVHLGTSLRSTPGVMSWGRWPSHPGACLTWWGGGFHNRRW